jgi:hypothetical protein
VVPTWPRWAVAVCITLAVASFGYLERGHTLVVVAGRVVPGWAFSAVFLAAGAGLGWLGRMPHSFRYRGSSAGWITGTATGRLLVAAWILTALLVVLGVGWDAVLGVRYHFLRPAGPGGCQLVVAESSFTFAGGGTVYLLGARGVLGHEVGRYTADDGYRPVGAGSYQLTWRGRSADLSFWEAGISTYFDAMTCP